MSCCSDPGRRSALLHPAPRHLLPWLEAIAELCRRHWSDGLIAKALSALTLPAMALLNVSGWNRTPVFDMADECEGGGYPGKRQRFSRRRVFYYRHYWSIPRTCIEEYIEADTPLDCRRLYQTRRGWGHLLPQEWDDDLKVYNDGRILRPREIEILCILHDNQFADGKSRPPMNKEQITAQLFLAGFKGTKTNGRDALSWLVMVGLVERTQCASGWTYSLPASTLAPERSGRDTSVERNARG